MLKSRIGRLIDDSPYKNEYIMKEMKISRNTLSNWRTGKALMSIEKAFKLSRILKVSIEEMFEYHEDPKGE